MERIVPERPVIPTEKCPYCGGNEFAEAKQRYVSPVDDRLHGSVMFHTICMGCGSVVRSYIKDIAPFLKK
ncbi:MAG: hypothetical protein K6B74_00985 [Ruminococcus sp.]|nr:hypothetical protein [Ruminococcus sp.]